VMGEMLPGIISKLSSSKSQPELRLAARKKVFDERKICYALFHEVFDKLEVAFAGEPEITDGGVRTPSATARVISVPLRPL
jgi:hypothetical protein